MLTNNGIHSDVASFKVATSGGPGAASDDISNVQPEIKSTSVAAFTKAFSNKERDATASKYSSTNSRKPHPNASKQVKETQHL